MAKSSRQRQARGARAPAPAPPAAAARSTAWVWLLAALVTVPVYWSTTGFSFLLDDVFLFKESSSLHSLASIPRGFVTDIGAVRKGSTTVQGSFYRPVFLGLSTLYYQGVGASTFAWHLASVLLAAVVAGLAALFLLRLEFPPWGALLGALVFAFHPSHVSSVAWVSGLQEQLAALFILLSLLALLAPAAAAQPRRAIALAAAAFVLALLSKEVSAALLPMVAVWAFARRRSDPEESRRFTRAALVFTGVAAVYLAVRFAVLGALARPWAEAPGFARAVPSLPLAFFTYVHLLMWPTAFSFFRPERPFGGWLAPSILLSAAAVAALAAAAVWGVRRRRELLLPIAWFVVWLLPVMNFWALYPEWMVTDRYLYVPSLALPWLLLVLLPRRARLPVLAAVAVLFAVQTVRYAAIFVSPKVFSTAMMEAEPTSSYIIEERARVFLNEGKPAAAEAMLRRALAIDPDDADTLWKLGTLERRRGDFAAAEQHYRQATIQVPDNSEPFATLATDLSRAGQRPEALALLREAVRRWPDHFEPRLLEAVLLDAAGDRPHAEEAFAAARRAHPEQPLLAHGLDDAVAQLGPTLGLPPR